MSDQPFVNPLTPEQAGLPSEAITEFLTVLQRKQLCMHSVIMLRHGKVIAETYAPPYNAQRLHRMYSISKSFTALAIGLLIGEGKLSLKDKVADLMLDDGGAQLHPKFRETTVHNLLTMAAPMDPSIYNDKTPDWVASFFAKPFSHAPGALFSYNTAATVVLSAIVEKISGQTTVEYMRPRLLDPLGFPAGVSCVQRPEGGDWGGSGILCRPRDLACLTLLLMRQGRWQGKQLLPEDFVAAAISRQIDTGLVGMNSERGFGYGYQIWRTRNNGFAMIGMGGQYGIALPDKDFALITTADTQMHLHGANEIMDALWSKLYPYLQNQPLPANESANDKLRQSYGKLKFPEIDGTSTSATAKRVSGRQYRMDHNPMGIDKLRFEFHDSLCSLYYSNQTGDHCIHMGMTGYISGGFPETNYHGIKIGTPADRPLDCLASARWADPTTLAASVYITDIHLGTLRMKFSFGENDVSVQMTKAAEWFLNDYQGFAYGTAEPQ